MNILITGSTGFVGINLVTYLREFRFNIIGITRNPKSSDEIEYESLTPEVWNGSLAMVHLAGKAHDLKKTSKESEYFEVNTTLTKSLFQQFLNSDCSVFIYMSSVKAAADKVERILTEDVTPKPLTAYGKSKLAAEEFLLAQELPTNKRLYILRPCMIHGPGNKGNLNLLYQLVAKGLPWPLGAFENQRSFLSIGNLCLVIKELLAQTHIPFGIYNVADDAPLSTNELIQLIAVSQNKQARIFHIPKGFIGGLAKFGDYLHLPLNSERLQKLTESYEVSNQKIVSAIGKPLPIASKEGLLKTFQSFKK